MTKYTIKTTGQFKKDYKLAQKRHLDTDLLKDIINNRECHILPDWLLIYRIEDDVLVLTLVRSGTHSDLFGK